MGLYTNYPNSIYNNGGNGGGGISPFINATDDILDFDPNVNLNKLAIYLNEDLKFGILTGFVRKSVALDSTESAQMVATLKTDKYTIKSLTCCNCSGNKSSNGFNNDFMCPVKFDLNPSRTRLLLIPELVNGSAPFSSNVYGNGSSAVGYIFID